MQVTCWAWQVIPHVLRAARFPVSRPTPTSVPSTALALLHTLTSCHANHTHHADGCVGQYGWATVTLSALAVASTFVLANAGWKILGLGRTRRSSATHIQEGLLPAHR